MEFEEQQSDSNNKLNKGFQHNAGENASYFGSSGAEEAEEGQSSDTIDSDMMAAYQFAIRNNEDVRPVENISALGMMSDKHTVPALNFKQMQEQQRQEQLDAQKQLEEDNEQDESEDEIEYGEEESDDLEMIEALNMIDQQQQPMKK